MPYWLRGTELGHVGSLDPIGSCLNHVGLTRHLATGLRLVGNPLCNFGRSYTVAAGFEPVDHRFRNSKDIGLPLGMAILM